MREGGAGHRSLKKLAISCVSQTFAFCNLIISIICGARRSTLRTIYKFNKPTGLHESMSERQREKECSPSFIGVGACMSGRNDLVSGRR